MSGPALKITDSPSTNDLAALRAIIEGTAHSTGEEFFQSLVRHLATAMGVSNALTAEFSGPGAFAAWRIGKTASWRPMSSTICQEPRAKM